jgi:hypothetical protein
MPVLLTLIDLPILSIAERFHASSQKPRIVFVELDQRRWPAKAVFFSNVRGMSATTDVVKL